MTTSCCMCEPTEIAQSLGDDTQAVVTLGFQAYFRSASSPIAGRVLAWAWRGRDQPSRLAQRRSLIYERLPHQACFAGITSPFSLRMVLFGKRRRGGGGPLGHRTHEKRKRMLVLGSKGGMSRRTLSFTRGFLWISLTRRRRISGGLGAASWKHGTDFDEGIPSIVRELSQETWAAKSPRSLTGAARVSNLRWKIAWLAAKLG